MQQVLEYLPQITMSFIDTTLALDRATESC